MSQIKAKEEKVTRVRRELQRVRSPKGMVLPETLIERICALQADRPDLYYTTDSAKGFMRDLEFFKRYSSSLRFFDDTGRQFHFSLKVAIQNNRVFAALFYPTTSNKKVRIYLYFPFD